MTLTYDLGGNDLVVNTISTGATKPGQTGTLVGGAGGAFATKVTVTSNNAASLAVGPNGATTPILSVDSSTSSAVAGLSIKGAATGGTVAIVATDSGSNTNLSINAKGTGTITIGSVSTGNVTITPSLVLSNNIFCNSSVLSYALTAPSAGTALGIGMLVSSTANLGIFFGTGAPSFSAAQGSLYVNTTASTATTRLYVNTTGSTTWANFTASA